MRDLLFVKSFSALWHSIAWNHHFGLLCFYAFLNMLSYVILGTGNRSCPEAPKIHRDGKSYTFFFPISVYLDASLQPATRIWVMQVVFHSITIFYFIVYSWSCQLKFLVFLMLEFKTNTHCFVFIRSSCHPWIMDIDVRYLIQWLFVLRRYIRAAEASASQ